MLFTLTDKNMYLFRVQENYVWETLKKLDTHFCRISLKAVTCHKRLQGDIYFYFSGETSQTCAVYDDEITAYLVICFFLSVSIITVLT